MVFNMHEAKTQLSRLVARAEAGEDIVIARDGQPVVRLAPVRPPHRWAERVDGLLAGRVVAPDDFDDAVPGLESAVYGDGE